MEDDECLAEFRVKKQDLETLAEALQIPESFYCQQQRKIDGLERCVCYWGVFRTLVTTRTWFRVSVGLFQSLVCQTIKFWTTYTILVDIC